VATVSHELRGPLTVISGWMNILLGAGHSPDTATLAKALAAIGRGVTAQGRLISDLLDQSRLVAGKLELQPGPVDMLLVAESAWWACGRRPRPRTSASSSWATAGRASSSAIPTGCSRCCGTCSSTRSSSRRAGGGSASRSGASATRSRSR
jgi:hypothetical protein